MTRVKSITAVCALVCVLVSGGVQVFAAATISGYILDPNWYARHPLLSNETAGQYVYGTGQYEYGVAGNVSGSTVLGFFSSTENYSVNYNQGVYGFFRKIFQADGTYTLATWDNWWRSSYLFNQQLTGTPPPVIMRLHANMWSYAPMWDVNYNEFGQSFEATGSSVVMVDVKSASDASGVTVSVLDGGPNGAPIGPSQSGDLHAGPTDTRFVWNGGELPTIPGHIYYLKIQCQPGQSVVLCDNEPIPDMSDAMPNGYAFHNGVPWSQTTTPADHGAAMDLGVTICSDDDGLLTNMFTRPSGSSFSSSSSVGETFTARGTSLISFSAWVPDAGVTYDATLYNAVGGTQVGVQKKSQVMRSSDPEIIWTWAPGECPLTPGNSYYIELTKDAGGTMPAVYVNSYNPYPSGVAYQNRVAKQGIDLAGTIMEEESPGSATEATVQFPSFPAVALADRGATSLIVRWTTDVPSDSTVEYAAWNAPYTNSFFDSSQVTSHTATLTGLQPNTMYHLRVRGAADGYRTGVTRDFVACTVNGAAPNLLANPGFEAGSGASPRQPIPNWSIWGAGLNMGESDGSWFGGVPPYAGSWVMEGATNGVNPDTGIYQTVTGVTPGKTYHFTCAVSTWMQENDTTKYDVWNNTGRLGYMRIGIDPTGGTNALSSSVHWMPWMYSHLHFTTIGMRDIAQASAMTVFIAMKAEGEQWSIFGVDDCRLSQEEPSGDTTPPTTPIVTDDGLYTTDTTQLHATWSASDPESGIAEYQYSIGTSAGATGVLGWTSAGTATSVTQGGLALAYGQTYYVNVKALNGAGLWSDVGSSGGITVARPVLTISGAKSYPDGSAVQLLAKPVSMSGAADYWIEEAGRSSGIRVHSAANPAPGSLMSVTGTLQTISGERSIASVVDQQTGSTQSPRPLFIGETALGGRALNTYTPGITGATGVNNIGLLVTIWGNVTATGADYFYVDDGSGIKDGTAAGGSANIGVRVMAAPGTLRPGDFAVVTGASSTLGSAPAGPARGIVPASGGVIKAQ